jgi:putative transposase
LAEDEAALLSLPTITRMWALRGHQPIIPMNYGRQERKTLFGAVNLKTGILTGQIADTGNAKTFQRFLEAIRARYPRGTIIMILDNVRFHHAKSVQQYRTRYPRMRFLFLPPYHPKLNPQEMVWQILRRNVTHNTYYATFKKEIAAARRFFKHARVEIKNAPASLIVRK